MKQKYILTEETKVVNEHILHRIKAVCNFSNVKNGDLGGFIESETNLSHEANAWVYGNAKVYGNAIVYDDAIVFGNAGVWENARVYGNAGVWDNATVFGNAEVYGDAKVYGNAGVSNDAEVYGDARVCDNAWVYGNAGVYGNAKVCGNAMVSSMTDYIVFKNWWSSGRYFTWTRRNDKWSVGCFYGTGEELIAKAYKDSETSGREYQRIVEYVEAIKKKL